MPAFSITTRKRYILLFFLLRLLHLSLFQDTTQSSGGNIIAWVSRNCHTTGLIRCLYCRWLPFVTIRNQPSASTSLITSRISCCYSSTIIRVGLWDKLPICPTNSSARSAGVGGWATQVAATSAMPTFVGWHESTKVDFANVDAISIAHANLSARSAAIGDRHC